MPTFQCLSLHLRLSLSEGVRAARQRARQEICWTNNLRSSTTSLTQSLIQQASCAWCPETTCSTGTRFLQITSTFLRSDWETTVISKSYLDPLFHKKKIKNICLGKNIHRESSYPIVAHLWKGSFLHCLASTEAACESSLLNRLSRAKLLKPLSTAYSDGALCVCVCVCASYQCGFRMLALFVFVVRIYHCGFFRESPSGSFSSFFFF